MIPQMRITMSAPEPMLTDRGFLRIHNAAVKDALRAEALEHHRKRIPLHFQDSARGRYGYMARKPGYLAMKARVFGRTTDLVLKGHTRTKMTQETPAIRMGGRATNPEGSVGAVKATMILRFPFGVDAQKAIARKVRRGERHLGPRTSGVTIAQMRKEIATILPEEEAESARGFRNKYIAFLMRALASRPRLRRDYFNAMSAFGMKAG